ncbi:hypothetical protein [Mycobacterium sp. AZCC_0083]|uniref:hypothetical protein n=1 Tax=Mycobacterium sp. AZCC_0083 TaxID=2735882 RepID=UPI00161D17AA|nr:hypothetical protein [Mycobacterium sp. AZCC_0083]MBB5167103.1 hypothetical protein [Mycobacterium sp. AZCC_0083]
MSQPDWEWTDIFGDTLTVEAAGYDLILSIARKGESATNAVSLSLEQQCGLRAALGVHIRRCGQ